MTDFRIKQQPSSSLERSRRRASGPAPTAHVSPTKSSSSRPSMSPSPSRGAAREGEATVSSASAGSRSSIPLSTNVVQRSRSSSPPPPTTPASSAQRIDSSAHTASDNARQSISMTKMVRSASSNASAPQSSSSQNSTRPQSMRSVSSSIGGSGGTVVGGARTASTASPLNTPGDGPLEDPMEMASRRLMTKSPSALHDDNARNDRGVKQSRTGQLLDRSTPVYAQPVRSWTATTMIGSPNEEDYLREARTPNQRNALPSETHLLEPRLDNSKAELSHLTGRLEIGEAADEAVASDSLTHAPLLHLHNSSGAESRPSAKVSDGVAQSTFDLDGHNRRISSFSDEQSMLAATSTAATSSTIMTIAETNSKSKGDSHTVVEDVVDAAPQPHNYAQVPTSFASADQSFVPHQPHQQLNPSHTFHAPHQTSPYSAHHHHQQQQQHHHQQQGPLVGGMPSSPMHHPLAQAPSYTSTATIPYGPLPSSLLARNSTSIAQQPTDGGASMGGSSSYDAFRTPPGSDQYAAMYGAQHVPPSIASSSNPQSPTFGPHISAQQGLSDSGVYLYPYGPPSSGPANFGAMMPAIRPPPQSPFIDPSAIQSQASTPLLIHGMPSPQSPLILTAAGVDGRLLRRDSHISHGQFQHPPSSPHHVQSAWNNAPNPGMQGDSTGTSFMHSHSPSWPAMEQQHGFSSGGSTHRRMLSGPYQGMSALSFVPHSGSSPHFQRHTAAGRPVHTRNQSSLSFTSSYGRLPSSDVHQRSPLLEEFRTRQNRGRRFELLDIRGAVLEFSSDQHGSRFTQDKLSTATDEELEMVFVEILPHARTLMTDVFGNYVVQKLIEHGDAQMRSQLVEKIQGHVLTLSLSTYGCRVVQRALDFIGPHERLLLANELKDHILQCVRDQNANHVVQKILERVNPTIQIDFIPQSFRGNVYSLAAHCYSCRVLQRIFEHCEDHQRNPLMEELLQGVRDLMHDQYGNYVVQWVLRNASRSDKDRVINQAKGNVVRLSKHKFASNVVEQIIAAASQEDRYALTEEVMQIVDVAQQGVTVQPGPVESLSGAEWMMRDQYGNYVLQRFLEHAEGPQKQRLVVLIKRALTNMKRLASGTHTKHLVAIERLLESNVARSNAGTMTNVSLPAANHRPVVE